MAFFALLFLLCLSFVSTSVQAQDALSKDEGLHQTSEQAIHENLAPKRELWRREAKAQISKFLKPEVRTNTRHSRLRRDMSTNSSSLSPEEVDQVARRVLELQTKTKKLDLDLATTKAMTEWFDKLESTNCGLMDQTPVTWKDVNATKLLVDSIEDMLHAKNTGQSSIAGGIEIDDIASVSRNEFHTYMFTPQTIC
jgi:hypothetical protein